MKSKEALTRHVMHIPAESHTAKSESAFCSGQELVLDHDLAWKTQHGRWNREWQIRRTWGPKYSLPRSIPSISIPATCVDGVCA